MKDIQNQRDFRNIPIDKVGIKGVRYPITVRDRKNSFQHTVASINMYVDLPHDYKGTIITIEGPQFSTIAESHFYRAQGFDIIGMTLHPEVYQAREAQICFTNVSMITDYDVYAEKPVSHEEVQKTMGENLGKVKALLSEVIPAMSVKQDKCKCGKALEGAV